jgi:hypothetical protein
LQAGGRRFDSDPLHSLKTWSAKSPTPKQTWHDKFTTTVVVTALPPAPPLRPV